MSTHKLETEFFGRETSFEYSEHWVGYAILSMRVGIGWILLQGGLQKIVDPSWSAAGFLTHTPAGNPLTGLWTLMAADPYLSVINFLVVAGLTLTGIGIILGAFMRWNAFWASIMMSFFWLAGLKGGLLQGLPVEHGWFIDSHLVYVFLLIGLAEFGAGRFMGLDSHIEEGELVKKHSWIKRFLTG